MLKNAQGYGYLLELQKNGPNVLLGAGRDVCAAIGSTGYLGLDKRVRRGARHRMLSKTARARAPSGGQLQAPVGRARRLVYVKQYIRYLGGIRVREREISLLWKVVVDIAAMQESHNRHGVVLHQ